MKVGELNRVLADLEPVDDALIAREARDAAISLALRGVPKQPGAGFSGKKLTADHKAAISKSRKGKPWTDEQRANIEAAKSGGHTDETRAKISAALTGMKRPRMTCPHCGKDAANIAFKRLHGDKCKLRPGIFGKLFDEKAEA